MKRSEMCKRFLEAIVKRPEPSTEEEGASVILSVFEELGMLPPALPGEATHKIKDRCQWEAEEK